MTTKYSTRHRFLRILANVLSILAIVAVTIPVTAVAYAAAQLPFLGHWQAIDVDGSDMTLSIAGRPSGPFQITWTDKYISFCDGGAGLVRGTGWLNDGDANLLEADLHLECFTTGATLDFHIAFRYHLATDTLSNKYDFGKVTIWHHPGGGQAQEPPALGLRVNYGHDWVESFYEAGHTAWITLTESDGTTVKATAELVTEPKAYWGGETGFQSTDSIWFDAEGNPMDSPPDIQPNDWILGWVDNGASAQVQIGEIAGAIDLTADSIQGTIFAPWFSDQVEVECHSWGAPLPEEILKYDWAQPNGDDTYSCSWFGEWDIQPGQDVGVGYFGPDGHWVANTFFIANPTFVAYMPVTIVGYDWPMGHTINININDDEYIAQAEVGNADWDPAVVLFELWRDDFTMEHGDHIVMTDETAHVSKELWVTNLAVTDFDLGARTVSGAYDPAYDLWTWLYDLEGQVPVMDPDNGTWVATFTELPPGAWGGATQWDTDGDGTSIDFQAPNPNLYVLPDENKIYAQEWIAGVQLDLKVYSSDGNEVYSASQVVQPPSEVPWTVALFDLGMAGFDVEPHQRIVLNQHGYERELIVSTLLITGFDLGDQMVVGTGDPGAEILVRINGEDVWGNVGENSQWTITHPQLAPGVWGEAIQRDGIDGDETRDGFRAPMPMMIAWKNWDDVAGSEWTPGAEVTLSIDDPANGQGDDYTFTEIALDSGNLYYGEVYFDLGIELQTGYVLTMSDGNFSKTLVISALSVTGFDFDNHIIYGTGDAGAQLLVHINGSDSSWITVGDDHYWSVYHELLEPGVWLDAIQPDEDGDHTRDGGQAL